MKFLPFVAGGLLALGAIACSNDQKSTWDKYTDWREFNNAWLEELQAKTNPDGTPYYTTVVPQWNAGTFVLMHYFNDRAETEGNLSPYYTSTVRVRYKLHLCDGTPVDSSDNLTAYGDKGIYEAPLRNLVMGWTVAMEQQMRCGDTAEVIVPYELGYGSVAQGVIDPYSALRFNIRLVDIPDLVKP